MVRIIKDRELEEFVRSIKCKPLIQKIRSYVDFTNQSSPNWTIRLDGINQ